MVLVEMDSIEKILLKLRLGFRVMAYYEYSVPRSIAGLRLIIRGPATPSTPGITLFLHEL